MFIGLKIVNISEESITIKDVKIEYTYKDKTYSEISNVLITGSVFSHFKKCYEDAIIIYLKTKRDLIVVSGWNNLRTEISKHKLIEPSGIIEGSALFLLDFKDMNEVRKIQNLRIAISDYSNATSVHLIEIKEEWIKTGQNSIINPRSFTNDKNGKITFLPK